MQEKSRWYSCARDAARRGGVDSPQIIIEWAFGELYKFDSSSVDRTWKLITKIVKNRVKPFVQSWLTSFLVTWNFFLARFGNAMSVGKFGWYSPPPANPEAFATALSGAAMCRLLWRPFHSGLSEILLTFSSPSQRQTKGVSGDRTLPVCNIPLVTVKSVSR